MSRTMHRLWVFLASALIAGTLSATAAAQSTGSYVIQIEGPQDGDLVWPNVRVYGWAVDPSAQGWTGFDTLQVYLDGPPGGGGVLVGSTGFTPRPDVAANTRRQDWLMSGFSLDLMNISEGNHILYVYALSAARKDRPVQTARITVTPNLAPLVAAGSLQTCDPPQTPSYGFPPGVPTPALACTPAPTPTIPGGAPGAALIIPVGTPGPVQMSTGGPVQTIPGGVIRTDGLQVNPNPSPVIPAAALATCNLVPAPAFNIPPGVPTPSLGCTPASIQTIPGGVPGPVQITTGGTPGPMQTIPGGVVRTDGLQVTVDSTSGDVRGATVSARACNQAGVTATDVRVQFGFYNGGALVSSDTYALGTSVVPGSCTAFVASLSPLGTWSSVRADRVTWSPVS